MALICPAGWKCLHPAGADSIVEPCPLGSWSATGATACTLCEAGSACPQRDQSGFVCGEGFIQPATGKDFCLVCPFGQFSVDSLTCTAAVAGQGYLARHMSPQACFAGTYSTAISILDQATPSCLACDAGALCPDSSISATG